MLPAPSGRSTPRKRDTRIGTPSRWCCSSFLLQLPVGDRHARAQPHVLGPRADDVALDEEALLRQVAEHAPAVGAVAPAHGPDRADRAQERVAVRRARRGTRSGSAPGRRRARGSSGMPSAGSWRPSMMSLSPPRRTRTRRCGASSTRNVAAAASSATRVPCHDREQPPQHAADAQARLHRDEAIATARARTHAGAALCVPAPRLANTPTHDAPAPNAPTIASAVMSVAATSVAAITHSSDAATHHPLQRVLAECARDVERGDDGARAEAAEQHAEPARAEVELVARDDGQQRVQRARAEREGEVAQRRSRASAPNAARSAGRSRCPVSSDSGTPGSAGVLLRPRRARRRSCR